MKCSWTPDYFDKIELEFLQAVAVSLLLYSCTTWTLTTRLEKKLRKVTVCSFEQILEAAPHKTAVV